MNFEELLQEVYIITNRPDLSAESTTAIKAATLKAHRLDFFSKDIHETGIEFPTSKFRQSFDPYSIITNFRAYKYIKRVEDKDDDVGHFLEIITVEELLDSYGRSRADIAYVAGRVLEIRAAVDFQFGLLGCYVMPVITAGNYGSWVSDQYPYAIVYEAARVVFRAIGQMEESQGMATLVAEEYIQLKNLNISDVGS